MADSSVLEENARLKKELEEIQRKREQDVLQYEQRVEKERTTGKAHAEAVEQKQAELSSMRNKMVKLTKQLDEEVTRRDIAQTEAVMFQGKLQDITDGMATPSTGTQARGKGISFSNDRGGKDDEHGKTGQSGQSSTKLMRVVEHWMTHKDLQQALLRNASINDTSFSTLVQVLADCPSLQTLDLAQNHLTMDSCSEICNLITSANNLSFVSLADNLFSLRSLGYFMTAVMERQNTKKLAPLDILDLHGNEGLVAAANAPAPDALLRQVVTALGTTKLPPKGAELISQVMRALWRFLHDTGHPQVRNANADDVAFHTMDQSTIKKMDQALRKILLLADDAEGLDTHAASATRSVTADLVFVTLFENQPPADVSPIAQQAQDSSVRLPPIGQNQASSQAVTMDRRSLAQPDHQQQQLSRPELRDPFSDLKAAFEPPKEKLKTFNLKQIVTRNGTVLMNMLERLLETTEIDAHDVETEQTLLEYACQTGNVGLAKLCYRRTANLSARTKKGDTAFNIVTKNMRYDIMEFLHKYGVKVNSSDADGQTALHIAAMNNDVDGVCRLLEWGADVNMRDNRRKTPLHVAAAGGHFNVTMLLLEVGAEMNAQDEKGYTPAAWAEAKNHFALMDRLVMLGGKGHGLSQGAAATGLGASKSAKKLGDLNVSPQMLKSSSLGRIGKIKVTGLPEPLRASLKH
jgi:ankyrin repeat protein